MKHSNLSLFKVFFIFVIVISASAQQRIVLGGKAANMLADAVYLFPGTGQNVVAYASGDQGLGLFLSALDAGFRNKISFDKSAGAEAIAAFRPDLVVLKSSMKSQLQAPLDALGIRQIYLNLETPEQYYEDIILLGKALDNEKRATEVVSWFAEHEARIVSRTSRLNDAKKPKVLLMQRSSKGESVWQVPPDSWMQTILTERAGGRAVWRDANPGSGWATVSIEQIAAWNPDIIGIIDYREDSTKAVEAFKKDARLASLAAVTSNNVYGFPQDFYSWDQPDTRWILGLTWLAKTLQPKLFSDVSMAATVQEFFMFMYGFNEMTFRSVIVPKIHGDLREHF